MAKKKARKPNKPYELPLKVLPNKGFRMLALDPGTRNFGISMIEYSDSKVKVLANALFTDPINTMVEFNSQRHSYRQEVARWVKAFKPNAITAERFQTRGNGGPTIELVSSMLGILDCFGIPLRFITASTWKNAFNRRFTVHSDKALEVMYQHIEKPLTPHQLDSVLIGVYGLEFGFKKQLSYSPQDILIQTHNTNLMVIK